MKRWQLLMLSGALGCGLVMAQKDDSAALAQAGKLAAQCEKQLAALQQAATPGDGARYLAALAKLETQFKERGELQKVLALRDEVDRAKNSSQPLQAAATLPEARKVQETLRAESRANEQAAARKILAAATEAFTQLAALRKDVQAKNHERLKQLAGGISAHAALQWAHGVAPNLALPKLPDPPPDKPFTLKAGKGEPYTFYPLGKEPAQKGSRSIKLEIAFAELRGALANYNLTAGEAGGLPRVGVTAKNSDLPEGTKLVIEYFGRYPNHRGYRRESCEHIRLPAIMRGSGLVVDGHGMREYSSRLVAMKSYAPIYGIIISLFDEQGKIILQGCTPSALMQECRRELPPVL
jgi:hypothetical protein